MQVKAVGAGMSNFGFEPGDWLFLAGGVGFVAVVAAVLVF